MTDAETYDGVAHLRCSPGAAPFVLGSGETACSGLALHFDGSAFVIHVCRADGCRPLALGPFPYEDVVAVWRRLAADSGLPLLLRGPDGQLMQPYPQIGRLLLGARSSGRDTALLTGRRPRFLVKRRSSRLPQKPRIHREPEIASGNAR